MAYKTKPRKHLGNMIYTNYMAFPGRDSNTSLGYHRSCLFQHCYVTFMTCVYIIKIHQYCCEM